MTERGWRTGRKVGRTIYRIVGDEPSDDDVLIGMMDTPELAEQVVVSVCIDIRSRNPDDPERLKARIAEMIADHPELALSAGERIAQAIDAHRAFVVGTPGHPGHATHDRASGYEDGLLYAARLARGER